MSLVEFVAGCFGGKISIQYVLNYLKISIQYVLNYIKMKDIEHRK